MPSAIEGWFSPDAALMFMADPGRSPIPEIAGDVLEMGVHHGLSAIALAAMRGDGATLVAIEISSSCRNRTCGVRQRQPRAFRAQHDRLLRRHRVRAVHRSSVQDAATPPAISEADSRFVTSTADIRQGDVQEDLDLCSRILVPGGLLALDDYFNPAYPGVCEGAIKFWLAHDRGADADRRGFQQGALSTGAGAVRLERGVPPTIPVHRAEGSDALGDADSLVQLVRRIHRHAGFEPTGARAQRDVSHECRADARRRRDYGPPRRNHPRTPCA